MKHVEEKRRVKVKETGRCSGTGIGKEIRLYRGEERGGSERQGSSQAERKEEMGELQKDLQRKGRKEEIVKGKRCKESYFRECGERNEETAK